MRSSTDPTPAASSTSSTTWPPSRTTKASIGATYSTPASARPLGSKAPAFGARRSGSYPRSTAMISSPPLKRTSNGKGCVGYGQDNRNTQDGQWA
ncbi:unnamed protein product [Prunus armeniaca]|uniref:Uncharacterized protein n=1 Tax=Prunus armeniaca TaxID=36596 RepID=A0A6J5WJE3_PRUAR|nr:unnamed protein product [Prunus armeniaca]